MNFKDFWTAGTHITHMSDTLKEIKTDLAGMKAEVSDHKAQLAALRATTEATVGHAKIAAEAAVEMKLATWMMQQASNMTRPQESPRSHGGPQPGLPPGG